LRSPALHTSFTVQEAAALAGSPPVAIRPVVETLRGAHLIQAIGEGQHIMHDLVRVYAVERVGDGCVVLPCDRTDNPSGVGSPRRTGRPGRLQALPRLEHTSLAGRQ
jgi:hypothetical protein